MWVEWSEERKSQHYEVLLHCIPQVLEYSKPKSAGQKSQVTLERTKEEQGCLSLNYLSKEPIATMCLETILHHQQQRKKQLETQNQLSSYVYK